MGRREIGGGGNWISCANYVAGETIFDRAQYMGSDTNQNGTFQKFFFDKETWFIGATAINSMCQNLIVGDYIELQYEGLLEGKKTGREYHGFKMWVLDPDDETPSEPAPAEEIAPVVEKVAKTEIPRPVSSAVQSKKPEVRKRPAEAAKPVKKVGVKEALKGLDSLE